MAKRLYVGNLPFKATEDEVREAFAPFGEIAEVKLITDRETGRPRGFGFVEMSDDDAADKAIAELDGSDFGGRRMHVNVAKERAEKA